MTEPQRAIIYCRQSLTREEDGETSLSLDFQERESRLFVAKQGWTVIEPPILDPDVKGWDPLRPGIADLLARLERDRIDVVVVYAMSRFARDYILQETIWRQIRERGARLISVHEPHAEDDLVRGILGVVSQAERRRMGAFLSSSFRERARRGLPHGKTPFGFVKNDEGRLVVHEDHRHIVLEMVRRLEDGWSLWRTARWLNETHAGGRTWEPNVVRNTVRTPAIAGAIKCADVLQWDTHEPIIDRERWERLRAMLDSRRTTRTKSAHSWLEGIIRCGCGAPMHLIMDRSSYRTPTPRFRCSADPTLQQFQRPRAYPPCAFRPRSVTASIAEQKTIAALIEDLDRLADWRAVQRRLEASYRSSGDGIERERRRLKRELQRLTDERERLLVLYRRGSLDVDRWEAEDAQSNAAIETASAELDALPLPPDPSTTEARALRLETIRDAITRVVEDDVTRVRRILQELDVTVHRDTNTIEIDWPPEVRAFIG
jgi:DNA invertase Pin-like site-specific DNA recombinase